MYANSYQLCYQQAANDWEKEAAPEGGSGRRISMRRGSVVDAFVKDLAEEASDDRLEVVAAGFFLFLVFLFLLFGFGLLDWFGSGDLRRVS